MLVFLPPVRKVKITHFLTHLNIIQDMLLIWAALISLHDYFNSFSNFEDAKIAEMILICQILDTSRLSHRGPCKLMSSYWLKNKLNSFYPILDAQCQFSANGDYSHGGNSGNRWADSYLKNAHTFTFLLFSFYFLPLLALNDFSLTRRSRQKRWHGSHGNLVLTSELYFPWLMIPPLIKHWWTGRANHKLW